MLVYFWHTDQRNQLATTCPPFDQSDWCAISQKVAKICFTGLQCSNPLSQRSNQYTTKFGKEPATGKVV